MRTTAVTLASLRGDDGRYLTTEQIEAGLTRLWNACMDLEPSAPKHVESAGPAVRHLRIV